MHRPILLFTLHDDVEYGQLMSVNWMYCEAINYFSALSFCSCDSYCM